MNKELVQRFWTPDRWRVYCSHLLSLLASKAGMRPAGHSEIPTCLPTTAVGERHVVVELMVSRALAGTSRLRVLLEQGLERNHAPSATQLEVAMAELLAECEPLIEERACLVPLALLLQRIQSETAFDEAFGHVRETTIGHDEFLRLALHDVARLSAGLSALLKSKQTTLSVVL